jgi:hypothetical protein
VSTTIKLPMTTMDIIMTRSSLRLVTVLLFITTTISIVEASVNPWGGSGSGGGSSAGPSDSYYAYSQQQYSLEQSPSSSSSSSTTSIVHDDTEITSSDHVDEPKIVSLINHEGGGGEGFVVSTQALFCQGGAGALNTHLFHQTLLLRHHIRLGHISGKWTRSEMKARVKTTTMMTTTMMDTRVCFRMPR